MAGAKKGDTVRVHYKGTLTDGTEFDSSVDRYPLQFKIGEGKLLPCFEEAVVGMAAGGSKTFTLTADDAYGQRRKDLVLTVRRSDMPPDVTPVVGEELEIRQTDRTFVVKVAKVTDEKVTLDANHPLAGEVLTFEIELVEVV